MASASENPFFQMINRTEYKLADLQASLQHKFPEIVPQDLSGKTVIVTGANVGIGYETTKSIASMRPSKIIMACRNLDKAREASSKIKSETGFAEIEEWELDLASFASVRAFSKCFLDTGATLDLLVSNAGVSVPGTDWVETKDGFEITIQVNHLSNMLLCLLLAPAVRKSKSGRIVVVASDVHFWATLSPNVPNTMQTVLTKPNTVPPMVQYCNSKILNVLFAKEFARRCNDVWICSANPGYTESELGGKDAESGKPGQPHHNPFLQKRPTYEGAKTIIHAAVAPNLGESGAFFLGNAGRKDAIDRARRDRKQVGGARLAGKLGHFETPIGRDSVRRLG